MGRPEVRSPFRREQPTPSPSLPGRGAAEDARACLCGTSAEWVRGDGSATDMSIPPPPAPSPQRVNGAARLVVRRDADGISRIADLYQRAPARMLFPAPPAGGVPEAVLLTTSGGLTGGDRIAIDIAAEAGAQVVATSQAAEKIYRCEDDAAKIAIRIDVAEGASAEWLMQETILFDGANLARRTEAEVAPTGRLLAVESVVFGRAAMGEAFAHGRLHDAWHITRAGKPVWIEAVALDGIASRQAPFGYAQAAGAATILLVDPAAAAQLTAVRAIIAATGARGGASSFDGLLVVRLLSDDAMYLRRAVLAVTTMLRGGPLPRVWSC